MKALAQHSRKEFDARAAAYLRHHYPLARFSSDERLLARVIDAGVRKAAEYDVTPEVDVIRLLELLIAIGGNFEARPEYAWIVDYLREPIRASLRLDYVCERLRFGAGEGR